MQVPFTIDQIETFLMIFIRTGAVIFAVPVFGSKNVPTTAKLGIALTIAWIIFPSVSVPVEIESFKMIQLIPVFLTEIFIGVIIGFVSRLFFEGIQLGGQIVGFQMGFGIANVIDPVGGANFSVIAQIKNLTATLLFIILGMHHWFIKAMAMSFIKIPLFHVNLSDSLLLWVFDLSSSIFIIAVKVAAPIMATLLFTSIALGIISKGIQGINIFIVGFPLKIAAGLFTIGLAFPMFAVVVQKMFSHLGEYIETIIKLAYMP